MNDPNGLVHLDGVYHLFHQYNPHGADWGHMSWGHATSTDLLTWAEQPPALPATNDEQVYSGSVVIDEKNTAGFAKEPLGTTPVLVAAYTSVSLSGNQAQALAFSGDGGASWHRYEGNPVLDRDSTEFRDPKLFRAADRDGRSRWVMLTVEAVHRQVLIHSSEDLRHWSHESTFGPLGPSGVVWECPDLFPLLVDDDPDRRRWVLVISTNPPDLSGPSGTHYLVGDFDGHEFTSEDGASMRPVDHGHDFYAATSFEGLDEADRTVLAWASNWQYAASAPTSPWRGAMSLPRHLSLRSAESGTELVQALPQRVSAALVDANARVLGPQLIEAPLALHAGRHLRLELVWQIAQGTTVVGLDVLVSGEHRTRLAYDVAAQELTLDRSRSRGTHFHESFAGTSAAAVPLREGRLELDVILDGCLIEVFADLGGTTITDLVMADVDASGVILFAEGTAPVLSGTLHELPTPALTKDPALAT